MSVVVVVEVAAVVVFPLSLPLIAVCPLWDLFVFRGIVVVYVVVTVDKS